jgi:hypothetical protein
MCRQGDAIGLKLFNPVASIQYEIAYRTHLKKVDQGPGQSARLLKSGVRRRNYLMKRFALILLGNS